MHVKTTRVKVNREYVHASRRSIATYVLLGLLLKLFLYKTFTNNQGFLQVAE